MTGRLCTLGAGRVGFSKFFGYFFARGPRSGYDGHVVFSLTSAPRSPRWFPRNQIISCTFVVALAAGCGGTAANKPSSSDEIRRAIAEAERKNRNKLRDLENQVVVLEDRLRSSDRSDRADQTARPPLAEDGEIRLPVEVRAPADDDSLFEVVGADEDGVEIVYVGNAADDHSVSIPTPPSRPPQRTSSRASVDDLDSTPGRGSPAVRYGPSERVAQPSSDFGDHSAERLDVTDKVGPTVDRQLRQARGDRRDTSRSRTAPVPRARTAREVSTPSRPRVAQPAKITDRRGVDQESPGQESPGQETPKQDTAMTATRTSDPKALYKQSYDALRAGDGDAAIAGFRDFLARHPDHDFADNSRYWLAEAFYARRDYATALQHFRKVLDDYPTGNKVPDALLKMGYCYLALGNEDKGRTTLAQVIERHPDSSPARLAARRLDGLDN